MSETERCPASGLPMVQEINGLWHNPGCCCYACKSLGWSNLDLDLFRATRAAEREEIERPLREALREYDRRVAKDGKRCLFCGAVRYMGKDEPVHMPDCPVRILLSPPGDAAERKG